MRAAWAIALLFLLPSLALSLLLQYAISLDPGTGRPIVGVAVLVLPFVGSAGGSRRAFARGLIALAVLSLLFCGAVALRVWTNAGAPVLEREGLLGLARSCLLVAAVMAGIGVWLLRRRARPAPGDLGPIE